MGNFLNVLIPAHFPAIFLLCVVDSFVSKETFIWVMVWSAGLWWSKIVANFGKYDWKIGIFLYFLMTYDEQMGQIFFPKNLRFNLKTWLTVLFITLPTVTFYINRWHRYQKRHLSLIVFVISVTSSFDFSNLDFIFLPIKTVNALLVIIFCPF